MILPIFVDLGLELFQIICVITLASYFIIRTGIFNRVLSGKGSIKDKFLIIFFFGALSIYGTISKLTLFGSMANVRDLGPVIAGLTFGPWIGLGTAIIGAAFRFSLGGVTAVPCTITTIIAGVSAGLLWYLNKKRYIGTLHAVIFIILLELVHLALILLIAGTGPEVQKILKYMWTTMLPLYIIGIVIYSVVYLNYRTEKKNLEELVEKQFELKSAYEIQNSFLPRHPPVVPGYDLYACTCPAREMGGDFFDYFPLDDGKIGFVIADVSGKSVPAAIFMALSCTIVRVAARWIQKADQVVNRVNTLITWFAESGMFFSMVYGVVSPVEGTVHYVNAGHPPPVLLRKNKEIEELQRTGTIIGFKEDRTFGEAAIVLKDGDLIVCYTDGVTEARSKDGTMFGKERLCEVIAGCQSKGAEETVGSILDEIRQFTGDTAQFDDITLLILKKTDPIP